MYVILLNGPPESGKDVLAEYLAKAWSAKHMMFKDPLYTVALTVAGLPSYAKIYFTDRFLKENEEFSPFYIAGRRVSPRKWLIHVSEVVVKPLLGEDFFGKAAAEEVAKSKETIVVFSDSGFEKEMQPLLKNNTVVLARIHRPEKDFQNDSRQYLKHDISVDLYNNESLEYFLASSKNILTEVLNELS